ncbi:MAG: hypothetical protein IPM42_18625 [Saprospiraceae bacterium]|nr:hypothetical protein [Saprospiraceae bacterium]
MNTFKLVENIGKDFFSVYRVIFILIFISVFISLIPGIAHSFQSNPLPTANSDVILQNQILFERFIRGEQPYAPINEIPYAPYPVYLPLQWLPIGLGMYFGVDLRWGGIFILFIIYVFFILDLDYSRIHKFYLLPLLLLPLYTVSLSNHFRMEDLNSVFDIHIYAYYFLLAYGLYKMDDRIIFLGLVFTMLSRYTAIFWIPLLFMILYHVKGKKVVLKYIILGIITFLLFYILPFFVRDPSILLQGLDYHNRCGIAELEYFTVKNIVPYNTTVGLSYLQFYADILSKLEASKAVTLLRIFQFVLMLLVNIAGWLYFRNNKLKVIENPSGFLLSFLVIQMLLFYASSPLVFSHYWFTVTPVIVIILLNFVKVKIKNREYLKV